MCSIWNMCLQRWADHSFWTLSHSGAAPEASGSFSVVFICEEDRQREHFSGPGSQARALCKCQPALASAHIKDVFRRFSVSGFCGFLELERLQCASKIRLAAQSGTLRSVNLQQPWEHKHVPGAVRSRNRFCCRPIRPADRGRSSTLHGGRLGLQPTRCSTSASIKRRRCDPWNICLMDETGVETSVMES